MYIFITVLIFLAAILLTLLVLVQNSKGGGLAAGFSSGNQVMGAPKTADFLEKATCWCYQIQPGTERGRSGCNDRCSGFG